MLIIVQLCAFRKKNNWGQWTRNITRAINAFAVI